MTTFPSYIRTLVVSMLIYEWISPEDFELYPDSDEDSDDTYGIGTQPVHSFNHSGGSYHTPQQAAALRRGFYSCYEILHSQQEHVIDTGFLPEFLTKALECLPKCHTVDLDAIQSTRKMSVGQIPGAHKLERI